MTFSQFLVKALSRPSEPTNTYENFIVAEIPPGVLNESTSGVTPHSSPNVALARNPPNSLTGGPTTKSFSLSSVWYGCDLFSAQSLLAAAAPCTITVTGFKAGSSSPVATQVLSFTTSQTVSLSSPPAFATFSPKFKNLHSVNITVEPSDVIFIFDNLIGSTTSWRWWYGWTLSLNFADASRMGIC